MKIHTPPQQPRITQRRHELKSKHIKPTGSHLKRQFQACLAGERDSALSECVTSWEPETWSLDHVTLPSATWGDHPSAHRLSFLPAKKQVCTSVVIRNTKGRKYSLGPISRGQNDFIFSAPRGGTERGEASQEAFAHSGPQRIYTNHWQKRKGKRNG